jgi:hypothetical protein
MQSALPFLMCFPSYLLTPEESFEVMHWVIFHEPMRTHINFQEKGHQGRSRRIGEGNWKEEYNTQTCHFTV